MNNKLIWRLELLRDGLSGRKFADKCTVPEPTMRGYLTGKFEPTLGNLIKIANACGVSVGWLAAGEGDRTQNGEITATIGPGDQAKKARLMLLGEKASHRNIHLREIVEWMDQTFGENEEQALIFYDDLKRLYQSFADFRQERAEKKRPSDHHLVAEPPVDYNKKSS